MFNSQKDLPSNKPTHLRHNELLVGDHPLGGLISLDLLGVNDRLLHKALPAVESLLFGARLGGGEERVVGAVEGAAVHARVAGLDERHRQVGAVLGEHLADEVLVLVDVLDLDFDLLAEWTGES